MLLKLSHIGWAFTLLLIAMGNVMAQPVAPQPVKPTGPAAKKAEELIQVSRQNIDVAQDRRGANICYGNPPREQNRRNLLPSEKNGLLKRRRASVAFDVSNQI